MRCLFCGKALRFRFGAGAGQFCGAAHHAQYQQMVLSRLEPEPVPASPPRAAGFRSETVRVAPPEARSGSGRQTWRVSIPESRRSARAVASAATASLAARPIRTLAPPAARLDRADLAGGAAWRRFGNPPAPRLLHGRCAPRRFLAAGPIPLRLDCRRTDSRPEFSRVWRGRLRTAIPRIAVRGTVRFTLGVAPPRALAITRAAGPAPPQNSVAVRQYAWFVVPKMTRKPIELQVPSAAFSEAVSLLDEQESHRPRRLRRLWIPAVLSLLTAGALLFPRIAPILRNVRWERPAFLDRCAQHIESRLRARAALVLEDNFTNGLSAWDGGSGGLSDWVYDQAGLVQPGKLGILKASRSLSNYRFEILAQIRKKGLSWAFRATDQSNYYAMKIVITRPGPVPRTALIRYAVVRGIGIGRVQVVLPPTAGNDTIYRVVTRAYQDGFVTSVNGQVVDSFADRRHPAGGVGLFSESGEEARIVRIRVADRDDLIGKIYAYFLRLPADSWSGPAGRAP